MTATPRPAATVVLVRDAPSLEIFFVRRHRKSGFMASAYVFPGGTVDEADADPRLRERVVGLDAGALVGAMGGLGTEAGAVAHVVAAIRETFEEAGVLVARRADGAPLDLRRPDAAGRLGRWRERLNAGEATLLEVVEAEDLLLDGGAMRYFAHWITPTQEPRRYDTRFFLARAPDHQEGLHDGREVTDSAWVSPRDALAAHSEGAFHLAPPTWRILGDTSDLAGADEALRWAEGQAPPPTIMPQITTEDGCLVIALPGDPLHPDTEAEDAFPRRVVLRDGCWADG
ncbi:MAG: NUDIX hydrolase [Myxococcota bacterium]